MTKTETLIRLSAEVVRVVSLRMVFLEDQGEPLDIENWLVRLTVLEDQGDYWLMVFKDKQQ